MNLYFMRHGIAVAADDPVVSQDSERSLSNKGMKRMRRAARGLQHLKIPFEAVLTSPVLRARQSAEIVAAALSMEAQLEETSGLAPESTVEHLLFSLNRYQDRQHLLLVGHEPLLSRTMASLLCGGSAKIMEIAVRRGSLCRIEVDGVPPKGPGILHWFLTSKQLRLMA